jgi:hypothetical protein
MKAYTWYGVMCDYNCGSVTTIAESIEEARAMIIARWTGDKYNWKEIDDCKTIVADEPVIEDLPCIIECLGSA